MAIRVLLADDHTVVRDGLKALLESEGDIEVVGVAGDGIAAVQGCRRLKPDVVVMDIAMPLLNGIDAAKEILSENDKVGVIVLSMYASQEHIIRALQAGVRGYLLKESAGNEVIQAIRSVAQGKRYMSSGVAELVVEDYIAIVGDSIVQNPLQKLSNRERQVLQLVVEGKTSADIACTLQLSVKTVETYRSRLMGKLGVHDIPGLVKFAIQHGLIQL